MMELITGITAAKEGVSRIAALAEIAKHAKPFDHRSVKQVLLELQAQAIAAASENGHRLDALQNELDRLVSIPTNHLKLPKENI